MSNMFSGAKENIFLENTIGSDIFFLLKFFGLKFGFLGLQKSLNLSVLLKGLLMQDWVFRLGICIDCIMFESKL